MSERICCGWFPEHYSHNDVRYNRIKEKTSSAAINAICANAGLIFQERRSSDDYDSIDVSVKSLKLPLINGREIERPSIDIQLKCTSSPNFVDGGRYLSYPLSRKNYDDLKSDGIESPLLAVMVLPDDVSKWMCISHEQMTIKNCIHWCNVSKCNNVIKDSQDSVSVRIPAKNILDTETLCRLLDIVSKREVIPYEIQ